MKTEVFPVWLNELETSEKELKRRNYKKCEYHIGRAHILSQKSILLHLSVHLVMFIYSWRNRNYKEMRGQVLRFLVVIPGHILGKVPRGNTGWSSVGLMEVMDVPKEFEKYLE